MKRFKKLMLLAVSAAMVMSSVSGCKKNEPAPQSSESSAGKTAESKVESTAASTVDWSHKGQTPEQILAGELIKPISSIKWPLSQKPITLKIMKPLVMYDSEYSKMALLKDYEKKTGITIEWISPPQANFTEQFNLIMNSGTDLPDAIIGMPEGDIERFGQQGLLISLNDLVDKNMPNLKQVLAKFPASKKIVTSDDSKMYSLPYVYQFLSGNNIMMARADWLQKLNLQYPETTDDWYKVLKAFKTQDPNGNGKQDEWPFSGYGNAGTGINVARSLVTAWGVFDGYYLAGNYAPKDDKVHYGPMESRYREALEWLVKLYSEGLIDPEIVTNDSKAFQAKALQNQIGAWRGQINGDMTVLNDSAKKAGNATFTVREMPIMKGPHGDQIHAWPGTSAYKNGFVITATNIYPKETAMWADYWYSAEGQTYVYGIEGLSYTKDVNGKIQITDWILKNPDGKTMNEARGMLSPGRSIWPTVFQPWEVTLGFFPDPVTEEGRLKYRKQELMHSPMPEGLSYTSVENDRVKQLSADINTFVDEQITSFIVGKQPLNDTTWNAYVTKLKQLGIEEVIKIHNDSYARWKKR